MVTKTSPPSVQSGSRVLAYPPVLLTYNCHCGGAHPATELASFTASLMSVLCTFTDARAGASDPGNQYGGPHEGRHIGFMEIKFGIIGIHKLFYSRNDNVCTAQLYSSIIIYYFISRL